MDRSGGGWHHYSSVFFLTRLGAAALAARREEDPGALIRRSSHAYRYCGALEHDLGACGLFANIALAGRARSDEGLWQWISDDSMRSRFVERGGLARPDGSGRYLTRGHEVTFHLEWDTGLETRARIERKVEAYDENARANVLWVAVREGREHSLRRWIADTHASDAVQHWTAHAPLLDQVGALGPAWRALGDDPARRALTDLPGSARTDKLADRALGKTEWWRWRLSGGEGA
jgi:hypothetical protein